MVIVDNGTIKAFTPVLSTFAQMLHNARSLAVCRQGKGCLYRVWRAFASEDTGSGEGVDKAAERPAELPFRPSSIPTGIDATSIYGDHFIDDYKPRKIEKGVVVSQEIVEADKVDQGFASLRRRCTV